MVAAVAMVLGFVMSADADVIRWTAPASCPDDAAVEARIAAYVEIESETSPTIATVVESEAGFEVELVSTIDGEMQRRTLQAATCETLADAVAAVIAVTIDPSNGATTTTTVTTRAEPAKAPTPEPPPEVTTVRGVADTPPVADLPARKPLELGLRIAGGWASAIAPGGSGIVGIAASIGRRPWSLELGPRLWIPRRFNEPDADYGVQVMMGTVAVAFCLRPPTRKVEVPLCAGVEAGGMRAVPRGNLIEQSTETFPWVAPLLRASLRVRLRGIVGLLLLAEGAVPTLRAEIRVDGDDPIFRTPLVAARVLAGLDFRWARR